MLDNRLPELLRMLPKVDLHLHLDGSIRASTLWEIAAQQGVKLPAARAEELVPFMKVTGECGSLLEYLGKFDFVAGFLHKTDVLERIAYEVVEQASEQNCRYIEVRFGPQLHRSEGLTCEEVIDAVLRGLRRGEEEFGVMARGIAACLRHHSPHKNMEVIAAAAAFKDSGMVAVDLAGPEAAFPAYLHRAVFEYAQLLDMPVTIHAGEAGGAENIHEAVTRLGATRIGHGVRLREDPKVMELVRARNIVLEMCPISNYQTKAMDSWETYPIREYFDAGLRLTINTDNLTVSDTSLVDEYRVLTDKFGFTLPEIGTLILNGVEAAFLRPEEKARLRAEFMSGFAAAGLTPSDMPASRSASAAG
ncbi:adenosine deaminase [Saccharibacillus alkalitolerans]|uniref:adenosine deaminase n=1 Tax=Saccharibacillus alkalitolerans TaxID=2705290 RepID=A0ABX0FCZ5_9BACL|nr:adenosine deaminase [Saccharibacillus alkalitolerans]NGZ78015.1 adenosine deaminase [Saccharibacillus alkalitolerans]